MRPSRIRVGASWLAVGLVLTVPVDLRADTGSEPFEVIVLRGASVSRVTGSGDGAVREELLREDPHPVQPASDAPEPAPEAPETSGVTIVIEQPVQRAPLLLGPSFPRHGPVAPNPPRDARPARWTGAGNPSGLQLRWSR